MTSDALIVALGSSFAAGPNLEPFEDVAAMRSTQNYAHLLADALGAQLVDLTVSGATTATILDQAQVTMTGKRFAPQIEGLPEHADVVTITAGGNDLGFPGSMVLAAWEKVDPDGVITQMMRQGFPSGFPEPTAEAVEAAALGLTRIVTEVRSRAAGARVLLVDYLTILPADSGALAPFDAEQTALFRRIQDAVAEAFRIAAERSGAELVAVSTVSRDHGLGSQEPWVQDFQPVPERLGGAFHPNLAGMRAVADELARVLGH